MAVGRYDFKNVEKTILVFWKDKKIYEKAKKKCKDGKKFYFLDGPPYTSGRIHIGQAWNYSMKDMVLRFKRMTGHHAWDRAGYDMHGLPTEHKVQEKFGLKTKEDIEKYGVEKFTKECEKFSTEAAEVMTQDFIKLGCWMDLHNAYMPISKTFMEGEWWLAKKAHENKRLYEGEKVMTWCPHCATAVAKHELEYKEVTDKSIFIKFKVKDKKNEYLVIWTTTPWTIPFNLGVMVHPDLDYVRAKVEDETWIVAKGLAGPVIKAVAEKQLEIIEEFKGKELEGIKYEHPFYDTLKAKYDELAKKTPKLHSVVMSEEYVNLSAGSGLVHMAPGCGPEDYEVGHREGIPPFNNIDEYGNFPNEMGEFAGWNAKVDNDKFIDALDKRKVLIAVTPVEHDYAHCWRCHKGVVFKTTKQWFFKVEDLKDKMIELNKNVYWVPEWAGSRNFDAWLKNLRDNSITRQRYWGTPVPIWKCNQCKDYVVVGSVKEIEELGGKAPKNLHKPHIDEVKLPCKCGSEKTRIPDIFDVWIDAGTNSWTCLDYPENENLIKQWWPADFILEGADQIRGWFNLLLVASMISFGEHPYKAVYMHGMITDIEGKKMSKSIGNVISPYEVIDKYGVDAFRYYTIGSSNPGVDMNFSWEEADLKYKNLFVLWNLHNFLIDLCANNEINPRVLGTLEKDLYGVEEKYITSRVQSTIKKVTELMEGYKVHEVPGKLEALFLDISRKYIQMIRDKAATGEKEDKSIIAFCLYESLLSLLKIMAPVTPYITETIYQNLKDAFQLKEESIHLYDWPVADDKIINKDLENKMDAAYDIMQAVFYARDKAKIGRRWPLKEIVVSSKEKEVLQAAEELQEIIMNQTNTKSVTVVEKFGQEKISVKADYAKLMPEFGEEVSTKIIAQLAIDSKETILGHIKKSGKYAMKIGKEDVEITEKHLIIEKELAHPYLAAEFGRGSVYINKERNDELDAEGYAREIMRHVQNQRKVSGFQKSDRIVLFVKVSDDLKESIAKWQDAIGEKVGAEKIMISNMDPSKKHKYESLATIKGEKIETYFDKL